MIDFQNAKYLKLRPVGVEQGNQMVGELLIQNEKILEAFQSVRDMIIFTNMRVIAVNVQGITGKKRDFTTLPYAKIQTFSIETAGTIDLDSELEIWFSGMGKVKFEFSGRCDIKAIGQFLSFYSLK